MHQASKTALNFIQSSAGPIPLMDCGMTLTVITSSILFVNTTPLEIHMNILKSGPKLADVQSVGFSMPDCVISSQFKAMVPRMDLTSKYLMKLKGTVLKGGLTRIWQLLQTVITKRLYLLCFTKQIYFPDLISV